MQSCVTRVLPGNARGLKRVRDFHLSYRRSAEGKARTSKTITMKNLNPRTIKLQYAVRGPLVIRATAIQNEIKKGAKKPFERVINANIGDAHAMGQKPLTFFRQVLACIAFPEIIEKHNFPPDVKARALQILKVCGGQSIGAYSGSHGIEMIRKHVAEYIEKRDGFKSDWNNVCLVAGASQGIKFVLQLLCSKVDNKPTGVMVPIPQYPLYSAALDEYGLGLVGYYLDEEKNWGLSVEELQRALCEGSKSNSVRAIVVINPGNPTGQVLTRKNIESIIKFAHENTLLIFADEVYQHNVHDDCSKFFSFKKVMSEMGSPYKEMEVASFMSVSKGYMGECGLRGGWMELWNLDPGVQTNLFKAMSAMLCPSITGQAMIELVANPPQQGDPSYELYVKEKENVMKSLKTRATMVAEAFNQMEGFKCNVIQGAMYAFPRITLPPKAIEEAKKQGKPADVFYAFQLLEESGICIIPGSGFGQRPGTYHFRTTILPQTELLGQMLDIFKNFQVKFAEKYK